MRQNQLGLYVAVYVDFLMCMFHRKSKAETMLKMLASYCQSHDVNNAFLLHSTGHKPAGSEIDASIIYADYYYVEALLRAKKIKRVREMKGAPT